MQPDRPNPFLGPRSFRTGETIYGRSREARDLLSLLIAERIVLLHSPSGAGKTSLLQAAIFPMLEAREFLVLPVIRVNTAPPALAAKPDTSAPNRYLLSMLMALEEGLPPEEQTPLDELACTSLAAYLARRIPADSDAVLLFDQFEELLTADVTDIAAKQAFCAELGVALRDRRYWAIFAMRDDYVAALEPYVGALPTRLAHHFRLELLGVDGARQALAEPARQAGAPFADAAVDRLIDDLRRVNQQQPDGSVAAVLGPSVEPVQLQVIGYRLWSSLPADTTAIGLDALASLGDVSQALADYYDERVAATVAASGVSERALRTWFDRELITPQGVRGQVLQGAERSAGLPNRAIRPLIDAYLVRAEPRRGATWYELAHDRLIAPVRASNAAWEEANLSALQRQADLWERQGRPAGLLLRDATLLEAEQWAAANPAELTPTDQAFLQLCRDARRQSRRVRNLAIGASILAVAASLAFVTALWFFNRAEEQRRLAEQNARLSRSRELAAASVSSLPADPQRSLLLGIAAVETTRAAGEPATPESVRALQQAAQAGRLEHEILGHTAGLRTVAYSPDGSLIATAGVDGSVRLWAAADGAAAAVLAGHADEVYALAFSPDGATLASAGAEGAVILWDVAGGAERQRLAAPDGVVLTSLAYSPDGALLAAARDDGAATLWDAATGGERLILTADPEYSLDAVAFSPDGAQIAVGGGDALVRVWDLATLEAGGDLEPLLTLTGPGDSLTGLAYSPDSAQLVGVGLDLRAFLWDTADGTLLTTLQGHAGSIYAAAFSPDGALLATASSDGTTKVWRLDAGQALLTLAGHSDFIYGVAFAPDGRHIATASLDRSARVWGLGFVPPDGTNSIAASSDGTLLASAGSGGVRLWDAASGAPLALLPASDNGFTALAFSPDGRTLAAGDGSGGIGLYAVAELRSGEEAAPQLELAGHTGAIDRLAFTPDGGRVVSSADDTTVRVWDMASGEEQLLLEGLSDWAYGLAISPDGRRIAAGDQGGTLIIWDDTGAELARVESGVPINALAFSPDGGTLAAAGDDGMIARYSADGAALGSLQHGAQVSAVAYSAEGDLFGAGVDGRISRWAADGAPGAALPAPAAVYALAPLPDGRLATAGADGIVHVFPLDLGALMSAAREWLVRGPTAAECASFRLTDGCP